MTPSRGLLLASLLLAAGLAGCGATPGPAPLPDVPTLLALDGRWDFPRAAGEARLAGAGLGPAVGEAFFGGGILARGEALHAADFAALDAGALRLVDANATLPAAGGALVDAAFAREAGLSVGDEVELRVWRWPVPLVATSFEMDRTRACAEGPAKLCFGPPADGGETELRLRVDPGGHDLAFLPDLAELGAGAAPAWWNGTFVSPTGERTPFQAWVDADGTPTLGERAGPIESGVWSIRYHLETAKGGRAPAGFAGIVRVREPGYNWFDDRLHAFPTGVAQAESVLANGTLHTIRLRVAGTAALPPPLASHLLLAPGDARRLLGLDADRVTGLVLLAPLDAQARLVAKIDEHTVPLALGLHARPLEAPPAPPPLGRALLFRAPPDVDVPSLPPVAGAGAPTKALALRTPVGSRVALDGENLTVSTRFLAHAGPADRPTPWTLPAGARWASPQDALENLTRSRTLALASQDLSEAPISILRLVLGDDRAGRVGVVVGRVEGGPGGTFWVSSPFAAGAGEPAGALVVLPILPGADPAQVRAAAAQAWAPFGLAPEPSSKP